MVIFVLFTRLSLLLFLVGTTGFFYRKNFKRSTDSIAVRVKPIYNVKLFAKTFNSATIDVQLQLPVMLGLSFENMLDKHRKCTCWCRISKSNSILKFCILILELLTLIYCGSIFVCNIASINNIKNFDE